VSCHALTVVYGSRHVGITGQHQLSAARDTGRIRAKFAWR
jgi:hypothetical protein